MYVCLFNRVHVVFRDMANQYRFQDDVYDNLCNYSAAGNLPLVIETIKNISDKDREIFGTMTFFRPQPKSQRMPHVTIAGIVSPIHEAAFFGHLEIVQYYINEFGNVIDINQTANIRVVKRGISQHFLPSNITLVMAACCSGVLEIVEFLVANGAHLHKQTRVWGPPLTIAAKWGHIYIIKYLITNGGLVNASFDRRHYSPLQLACASCKAGKDVVEYLLMQGADVYHRCIEGYTAIHFAANAGRLDILLLLIENGIIPVFKPASSNSDYVPCPLYLAAAEGRMDVVEFLIQLMYCPMICKGEAYLLLAVIPLLKSSSWAHLGLDEEIERFWLQGLAYIEESSEKPIYPPLIKAYNFQKEIATRDELLACYSVMEFKKRDIYFQAFMIAERCLGSAYINPVNSSNNLLKWIGRRGYHFIETPYSNIVEQLWLRTTDAFFKRANVFLMNANYRGKDHLQLPTGILSFLSLGIRKMIAQHCIPDFTFYIKFTIRSLEAFDQLYQLMKDEDDIKVVFNAQNYLGFFPVWLNYLSDQPEEIPIEFNSLGNELFSKFLYQPPGSTLLHQACLNNSTETWLSTKEYSPDLVTSMITHFLSWGGENAIDYCDKDGKRPLHLAVAGTNEEMKQLLVSCLISHGVHIDAVDRDGCAAIDYCSKGSMVYSLLLSTGPLPLSCHTARSIVRERLPYECIELPKHIVHFIQLHDPKSI